MMEGEVVGVVVGIIFVIAIIALLVIIWWQIFKKAGYGGAYGLLMIVPLANLVMLLILAFGEWPTLKKLKYYEQTLSMQQHQGIPIPQHDSVKTCPSCGSSASPEATSCSNCGASLP